jgi:chromosomal replication initiation ATPase DnaA
MLKVLTKAEKKELGISTWLQEAKLRLLITKEFGVTWQKVEGPSKERKAVNARQAYCFICYHYVGLTCTNIGTIINRHYSTVVVSNQLIRDMYHINDPIVEHIEIIKSQLNEHQPQA